jgi:cytochrome P450
MLIEHFFSKCSHIPGPKRTSFFLGNAELMKSGTTRRGNFGSFLLDLSLEYGHVFILWRTIYPAVVTTDLPAAKEFFTNLKLFQKPKVGFLKLRSIGQTNFIGNHSILSDAGGPNWERKKRIMDPGFKLSRLQEHISKFYLIGEQVADDLENKQLEAGFVDFSKVIAPYTIHAISSAGFSVIEEKTLRDLSDGASTIADYWVGQITQTNPLRRTKLAALLGLDGPDRPRAEKQLKYVRKLGKQLIMDRIDSGQFGRANDALDFIIKANEENGVMRMERCLDDFMTMYEAGNITTATTLSFFIAEMVRNGEILDNLIQEVDEIWVGRGISRSSPHQDIAAALKDMVYLDAVLNETLRKHPPVTVGLRILQKDMKVLDYKIPSGVSFVVSQQALQHHPQYWENPEIFDPSRFMGNKDIVPFTFVPFIVGPRRCLGKNFAILEMKVFISIWLSRLTFQKLPESEEDILTEQSLLVRILDNRVIVRMRH